VAGLPEDGQAVLTVRLAWCCSGFVDNGGVVLVMVSGI
jgi:hypothetical protein